MRDCRGDFLALLMVCLHLLPQLQSMAKAQAVEGRLDSLQNLKSQLQPFPDVSVMSGGWAVGRVKDSPPPDRPEEKLTELILT